MAVDRSATALLWDQPATPKRGPRPTLTLETIAAAAIAIADSDGLAAVTMQRVAEHSGVTKMALYRYVPGKVELVSLMIDFGLGEPPRLAQLTGGWRPKLEHWARLLFDRFSGHPWALEVTVGARPIGPNELGWLEQAASALAGTGLAGSAILDAVVVLVGHVRMIAQQSAAIDSASPNQAMDQAMRALLAGREEQFPALAAALADPDGKDQALDFGLERILDGIALLISQIE